MKRLLCVFVAVTLLCVLLAGSLSISAHATKDTFLVGALGESIWQEFDVSEMNEVARLVRREFNRGRKTRSEMHKGTHYFDYGESTGERLHAEIGQPVSSYDEPLGITIGCMIQDFGGGYSTSLDCFSHVSQWCCIIVTRDSFDKGEAYTIRDAVASQYRAYGMLNGAWGLPTSNQYWVVEDGEEVLYQQFEYGYARAREGSSLDMMFEFHHVGATNYDPDFPKTGSEDRPSYADVPLQEDVSHAISEIPEVPPPTCPPVWDWGANDSGDEDVSSVASYDDPSAEEVIEDEAEIEAEGSDDTSTEEAESVIFTEDDLAEETASTTVSTMRHLVRRNTTFHDFMLNYWGFLVAGGVVVIGALSVVLVLMKRKAHTK